MILGWLCRFFWNDGFHNSTVNWGYRQKSLWIANEENSENFPGKRDEFTSQIMKPGALGKEGDFLSVWDMGMDQYLWIPFLGGWTSIYQLFWCELQGYKVLTHCHILIPFLMAIKKIYRPKVSLSKLVRWCPLSFKISGAKSSLQQSRLELFSCFFNISPSCKHNPAEFSKGYDSTLAAVRRNCGQINASDWVEHQIFRVAPNFWTKLVGGFNPSENMKVSWGYCPQYMEKYKMFQTTNQ